jgi:hypothetical protein
MSQLRQGEPWALKMLDAMTKLPSGMMLDSRNHFGNYGECLSVSVEDEEATFQGQYFRAWSKIEYPGHAIGFLDMTNAFCVPSTCSPEEIPQLMLEIIGPALGINIFIHNGVYPPDCHIKVLFIPVHFLL